MTGKGDPEVTITELDAKELAEGLGPRCPPTSTGSRLYLVMSQEDASVRVIDLAEGETVSFGRSSEATFTIEDSRVSRKHASLARRAGQILIADLGSRNGTKINGDTLKKEERA